MFGIDVSEHQGEINWDKVKSHIDFTIIRIGWIGNNNNHTIDKQFQRNYEECKRLKIPVGIYVYCYCNNEETVKQGAKWILENIKDKKLDLPIYIDLEDNTISNLGKEKLTNICIEFNTIIENSKLWAGVYANENWFNNYLNKDEIKRRYTTWIASYKSGTNHYQGEYDIWQNSSNGNIEGISGNVDTNYMYRDLINQVGNTKPEENNQEPIKENENTQNNQEKGEFEMAKIWKNGSTNETVYADTAFTTKIGTIFPYEEANCYGIIDGRYLVLYNVYQEGKLVSRKTGFVLYNGGLD